MNRSDLLSVVHMKTGASPETVRMISDCIFNTIRDSLHEGEDVMLPGFGRFFVKERAARRARNIYTGETMDISGGYMVRFRPSSALKNALNSTECTEKDGEC